MLKVERLRELLKYNSETGEFTKNSGKPLVPDFSNLLHIYDPETRKVTKMKADLVAWILFYGIALQAILKSCTRICKIAITE